jgi:hypothetical protein
LFNFINASSSLRRSPNTAKPSPPNQIINKHSSIFDTHRRFFGNKNLAVEYEQTTDGNTEAYFTLLTLAEGTVLLNGVKALVAKVGGTEALKIIAKETALLVFLPPLWFFGHLPVCLVLLAPVLILQNL